MSMTSKKPPPRPPSPSPFKTQKYQHSIDVTDDAGTEIDVFESEPQRYETKTKLQPSIQTPTSVAAAAATAAMPVVASTSTRSQTPTQRKSVSFDLSDNEYISVVAHNDPEPSMSDDIGLLFLKQFSRENSYEENDGYEVPIKYPSGPNTKPTHQVKSILRSPSPSSKAPTVPSSLDRPLRTTYLPPTPSVTTAIVHTVGQPPSDDEIEHENPFRMEFLGRKTKENIYEELNDSSSNKPVQTKQIDLKREKPLSSTTAQASEYNLPKQRPKSTYEPNEYTEILASKAHQSNDDLSTLPESSRLDSRVTSASAGSLLLNRPNLKPPLPPKPQKSGSSIKSSTPSPSPSSSSPAPTPPPPPPPPSAPSAPASTPLVIKQADLKENEALKTFQQEMLRGDLYEFIHDAHTNQITKVKQKSSSIPIAIAKQSAIEQVLVEEKTKELPRLATFNPSNPLPPIPKSPKSQKSPRSPIPPYSKVLKRPSSVDRPTVSPPPPPVNLKTLPTPDKLTPIKTDDGARVEILSTSTDDLRKIHRAEHQENAAEYSLVTEDTHREILLQENEIRNAMLIESSENISITSSRIPVRKAPQPPSPSPQLHSSRQHSKNTSISSDVISQDHQQHAWSTTQSTSSSPSSFSSVAATSTAQVFPVTQILPVQYSHLPTPQQPDYFLAFPSSQPSCNVMPMPQPGAFSTFMVSDNSVAQTANIPTNIMYSPQQMHPMYLQRQFISVPISTAIHSINQSEPNVPEQNFVNMHANVSSAAQASILPTNNNLGHTFDVYRSDYYQHQQQNIHPQQQQQQQQPTQQYHYQAQSQSLPSQSSAHTTLSQCANFDSKASHSKYQMHDDLTNSKSNNDSSPFSSMTLVDSQLANNQNNNNQTDISIRSTESLTTISNLSTNYRNVCDELPPEQKPSFTTFGKQTQV